MSETPSEPTAAPVDPAEVPDGAPAVFESEVVYEPEAPVEEVVSDEVPTFPLREYLVIQLLLKGADPENTYSMVEAEAESIEVSLDEERTLEEWAESGIVIDPTQEPA